MTFVLVHDGYLVGSAVCDRLLSTHDEGTHTAGDQHSWKVLTYTLYQTTINSTVIKKIKKIKKRFYCFAVSCTFRADLSWFLDVQCPVMNKKDPIMETLLRLPYRNMGQHFITPIPIEPSLIPFKSIQFSSVQFSLI